MNSVRIAIFAASLLSGVATSQTSMAVIPGPDKNTYAPRTYKVGAATLIGKPKIVCVIEGKWIDGESFHYEAWDSCDKITMKFVQRKPVSDTVEQVYGPDKTFIIPAGREVYSVANDRTTVWLYRDANDEMQEILVSD